MGHSVVHTCGQLEKEQNQYDLPCGRQCGDVVQMSQSGTVGEWNMAEIRVFGGPVCYGK